MAGMQSEEGLLAMACAAYIAGARLHISCGRGVGSAYNGASLGLFSHLLPKTTWSELMLPRGIQRDRTEGLGRKRPGCSWSPTV